MCDTQTNIISNCVLGFYYWYAPARHWQQAYASLAEGRQTLTCSDRRSVHDAKVASLGIPVAHVADTGGADSPHTVMRHTQQTTGRDMLHQPLRRLAGMGRWPSLGAGCPIIKPFALSSSLSKCFIINYFVSVSAVSNIPRGRLAQTSLIR